MHNSKTIFCSIPFFSTSSHIIPPLKILLHTQVMTVSCIVVPLVHINTSGFVCNYLYMKWSFRCIIYSNNYVYMQYIPHRGTFYQEMCDHLHLVDWSFLQSAWHVYVWVPDQQILLEPWGFSLASIQKYSLRELHVCAFWVPMMYACSHANITD